VDRRRSLSFSLSPLQGELESEVYVTNRRMRALRAAEDGSPSYYVRSVHRPCMIDRVRLESLQKPKNDQFIRPRLGAPYFAGPAQ
jgi:hypothetical protein